MKQLPTTGKLGLNQFFLNSLRVTWVLGLLADTIALLRASALMAEPKAAPLLHDITARQSHFDFK
jgi:hypothetical protein